MGATPAAPSTHGNLQPAGLESTASQSGGLGHWSDLSGPQVLIRQTGTRAPLGRRCQESSESKCARCRAWPQPSSQARSGFFPSPSADPRVSVLWAALKPLCVSSWRLLWEVVLGSGHPKEGASLLDICPLASSAPWHHLPLGFAPCGTHSLILSRVIDKPWLAILRNPVPSHALECGLQNVTVEEETQSL